MGYEGTYPPSIKKLFHPYWRYLLHTFFTCISGRKGGLDEISHTQMSAVAALIMGWNYNYSKFIFNEMMSNLRAKKKEMFLMYPRFLQMIFDSHYTDLVKSVETLDMKSMGLNSFGLMKQSRKGAKVVYMGLKPLVKFGRFAETEAEPVVAQVTDEHVAPAQPRAATFEISDDEEDEEEHRQSSTLTDDETLKALEAAKVLFQSTALKPP
ncbi:uncharacterized protein LOC143557232 [Bidens hawaiensis]|uniref:uncharacterized protein LOC143557232 n=1 Tax=Bidens hawaiensis TaxID=980011 RepID=UPI00404B258C